MGFFGGASGLALAVTIMTPLAASARQQSAPAGVMAPKPLSPSAVSPAAKAVRSPHYKGDPLEGLNRGLFSIHTFFDRLLFRPVAMAYKAVVPKVIRGGIRHVFSNIGEPVVFVNDMLQLKPKRAVRTAARFAINSTIGIGGLIDVAKTKKFKLPHHWNGFGNTLGRYGVGPGPYLFLPFIGPTDFRDLGGAPVDGAMLPLVIGAPFDRIEYQAPQGALVGLDLRAESDADLKALLGGAVDPYATLRSAFLQTRAAEVYALRHGRDTNANPLDEPLNDPAGGGVTSSELRDPLIDPAAPAGQPAPSEQTAPPSPAFSDPLIDPAAPPAAPDTKPTSPELGDPLADPAAKP
ncbi:VacJ family lipoprotein [Sphingomonas sp. H39-1-10]|uniref:MlaA family lipoprotein n=1 Tax=Sphingomonas pollutisoli TaxID=3030829 RepID=UPI0023B90F1B|nr:VacJ family lipoprotein [Sphingomonas pollutisoli]MDF0487294.1 VacJ family lipoprotein [Sphingomonas pollutisoli]